MSRWVGALALTLTGAAVGLWSHVAAAQPAATAGYPEPIVQWGVQRGESCDDIARALYGSAEHVGLLLRYNRIVCVRGAPLAEGLTLVVPAKVTTVPSAQLTSVNPQVQARPPGGGWSTAGAGQPLSTNSGVHTYESGRAGIRFIDRTRVYLASNTLVIIYGTASQTAVSKVPPPAVELETGEVQAGLAALRGDTVDVSLKGGGRVSAESRDTVVARKGERTRVAVFDGKAKVASAGQSVSVPTNFGTDFRQGAAPSKPRPLPPAPEWLEGGSGAVVVAPAGEGRLELRWAPVPRAASYRLEVSRDDDFSSLVVREEIPADARAFRGEKMPKGTYYVRVRAIDDEEFLGVAAVPRTIEVVEASVDTGPGRVSPGRIAVSPYGVLVLTPTDRLELSLDDGPFGPMLTEIDLDRMAPRELRLRVRGTDRVQTVTVEYLPVRASIDAGRSADGRNLEVTVSLEGVDGVDAVKRVAPTLRAVVGDRAPQVVALVAAGSSRWTARLDLADPPTPVRLEVLDRRGRPLGSTDVGLAVDAPEDGARTAPSLEPTAPALTPTLAMVAASRHTNVLWFSPTAPTVGVVSAVIGLDPESELGVYGQALAAGAVGPVGFEAMLRTGSSPSDATADTNGWLGVRWRIHRFEEGAFELGPGLRLSLPVSDTSPPAQLEPAFALGGRVERWSLLGNLGARVRLHSDPERSPVDAVAPFALLGTMVDILPVLRAHALLDGHLFIDEAVAATGGVSVGFEAGEMLFGGLGARLAPKGDREGLLSVQASFGVREWSDAP